ncbi:hypothetical protein NECAME_15261 [Necator americanus]|uniref:Ribosomal RNA-processing protein 40 n=1 Tax=Necator americanus TaxID=51031 RepID=W2SIS4_NECAM|nr:hypothetical protein NECAME_15261 [Necator americanus]ETN69490.1 hypothetical protein NECAME_15261 [Necator americanus]
MSKICLPGEEITTRIPADAIKIVGYGIARDRETGSLVARQCGVFRQQDDKCWISVHSKRYVVEKGDRVIGIVTGSMGDFYKLDIGTAENAVISYLSFEGATKRNRPELKIGDVVYAQVVDEFAHTDIELTCVDALSRAKGLGALTGGFLFKTSCSLARRLLSSQSQLLKLLGKDYKFEITVGLNGRIWLKSAIHKDVITIHNIIKWSEYVLECDIPKYVENEVLKRSYQFIFLRTCPYPANIYTNNFLNPSKQLWPLLKLVTCHYGIEMRYYAHKAFDAPATWFRETIVEPINNRNRLPYYHRKLTRVPEIDECGVNDKACFFEANEQFRLDKMVDGFILQTLRHRVDRCLNYNDPDLSKCAKVIEDMEENELNFFIKYGELGGEADVRDAYMKQKHRLIWERRHPEIMEERKKALKEHKEKLAKGEFDYSFWKKGMFWQDKKNYEPPYEFYMSKSALEGDKPLSKDWQYYKKKYIVQTRAIRRENQVGIFTIDLVKVFFCVWLVYSST